ncbi:proteasome accessory factor PafA2 family protein [Flaviflexus huanghaiensis]|uniref:proteasome accessory factor PafA2 family protein n=1 Tax=Flaviflexus huanghaiensis TaxID=1111473 RepID=UPI0015F81D75
MTGSQPPRILGLETEYAIISDRIEPVAGETPAPLTPAQSITELFRGTRAHSRSTSRYLSNGGRLYVDLGSHPEYATAECVSAREVVLQDRAGEKILRDLMTAANERLKEQNIRLHIFKTNTDSADATFGCHENYQVTRATIDELDPGFISFLCTRPILTGVGGVKDGEHVLSRRAFHIHSIMSPDPTKSRPLIVTREEAHADPRRFGRLQVTYGDSNIADTATELKVRLTAAVLDFLEQGGSLADLELEDPITALHDTSRLGPEAQVRLTSGVTMTALEMQGEVLTRCEGVSDLADIRSLLDNLTSSESASRSIDWLCKRELLNQAAARYGVPLSSPVIARIDLAYHDIDRSRGLAERLRQSGNMASLVTDEEVGTACDTPPADTRAAVRGRFVAEAERLELSTSVSWTHVRLDSPPHPQIDLMDAHASEDPRVDELIRTMRALPPQNRSALARLKAGLGPLG